MCVCIFSCMCVVVRACVCVCVCVCVYMCVCQAECVCVKLSDGVHSLIFTVKKSNLLWACTGVCVWRVGGLGGQM